MKNLDILESASGGPFVVRHHGAPIALADPAAMPYMIVLAYLRDAVAPGTPDDIVTWKVPRLAEAWAAHYDLPDFQSAQRLAYLIDHYRSALVYDLQSFCGVDLGDLWRARRWRTLLDYIDHLPGHSWYAAAVASDPEHAKMIAESLASREAEGEKTPTGPSLQRWTPEVEVLTGLRDDVRGLHYLIPASQGAKDVKPPAPLPRPHTPLEGAMKSAEFARRKAKHEELVARVLPHKRKS